MHFPPDGKGSVANNQRGCKCSCKSSQVTQNAYTHIMHVCEQERNIFLQRLNVLISVRILNMLLDPCLIQIIGEVCKDRPGDTCQAFFHQCWKRCCINSNPTLPSYVRIKLRRIVHVELTLNPLIIYWTVLVTGHTAVR